MRRFTLIGGLLGVTFGYWIAIWISDYWPLVVGGKPVASWVPYTIIGFEVMVLIGALSTVFGMFIVSRMPKITMTVGYDRGSAMAITASGCRTEPGPGETARPTCCASHGAVEVRE